MDYQDQIDQLWNQIEHIKATLLELANDVDQNRRNNNREIQDLESRIYSIERKAQ